MAALTAATFKAQWTEFDGVADAIVTAKLAVATEKTNATLFGAATFNEAVGLYTAHLLSISPFGQPVQAGADGKSRSSYLEERRRLNRSVASGPWAVGVNPGDTVASITGSDEDDE